MKHVLILACMALTQAPVPSSPTATLKIHIRGLRSGAGQVGCLLFNTAEDFPIKSEHAVGRVWAPVTQANGAWLSTCEFSNVAPGVYAVSVLHDENANWKMDTNFLHMPTEGYGASRDNLPRLSAPTFEDSKFTLTGGVTELDVHLRYP